MIMKTFGMSQFDPEYTLPSKMGDNPYVWLLSVNGFIIDVRHAPREIQEEALRLGLIPFIPGESPAP